MHCYLQSRSLQKYKHDNLSFFKPLDVYRKLLYTIRWFFRCTRHIHPFFWLSFLVAEQCLLCTILLFCWYQRCSHKNIGTTSHVCTRLPHFIWIFIMLFEESDACLQEYSCDVMDNLDFPIEKLSFNFLIVSATWPRELSYIFNDSTLGGSPCVCRLTFSKVLHH